MMSDEELIKNMWCEERGLPGGLCNFRGKFNPHERASDMGGNQGCWGTTRGSISPPVKSFDTRKYDQKDCLTTGYM